jgi:protein tyrosine/serine phosphatase
MTRIQLEGAHNVRDLDGLPAGATTTRTGVLFRSDALDALTAADVAALADERGLAHVVDLRSRAERVERGRGQLGETGVRYSELDVIDEAALARRSDHRAASFAAGVDPNVIIADGYVELLELGAPAFAAALESIVAPGGVPVLVHCAIGKDRTGVLVALLLAAAGVEREAIVADYALSHQAVSHIREQLEQSDAFRALAKQLPAFVFGATPETMELFLDRLEERWGGAEGYFVASGVDPAVVERWRQLFLDA